MAQIRLEHMILEILCSDLQDFGTESGGVI